VSTYYLVDLSTNQINDVVSSTSSSPSVLITGNYVVKVESNIPIENPVDLSDLLTKKYLGILGSHGLFTQISYDDMLDPSNIDFTNSRGVITGYNGVNGLYAKPPSGAVPILQTTSHSITWGGSGLGPSEAILEYEVFTYLDVDQVGNPLNRYYQELSTDLDLSVDISFNGGLNFFSTTNKALVTIPSYARGDQIVVKFTRETDVTSIPRVFIGSWSVLY
jgi:hypothetical protein